jgi:hypothetical protein
MPTLMKRRLFQIENLSATFLMGFFKRPISLWDIDCERSLPAAMEFKDSLDCMAKSLRSHPFPTGYFGFESQNKRFFQRKMGCQK